MMRPNTIFPVEVVMMPAESLQVFPGTTMNPLETTPALLVDTRKATSGAKFSPIMVVCHHCPRLVVAPEEVGSSVAMVIARMNYSVGP